jgi:hypothetical protein
VRPNLKLMIALLQAESDNWLSKYAECPDPQTSDLPCLDAFLRLHMMQVHFQNVHVDFSHLRLQELCTRAMRDMPRGCLPLIIGSTGQIIIVRP